MLVIPAMSELEEPTVASKEPVLMFAKQPAPLAPTTKPKTSVLVS